MLLLLSNSSSGGAPTPLFANPRFVSALPRRKFISVLRITMPQGPDFSSMDVGETVTGAIDFSAWLPGGTTIASIVSVTAANYNARSGAPASVDLVGIAQIGAASMSEGGSGVADAAVLQQWTGLYPGVARITVAITTSDGQTLIGWAHQAVGQPN